jgi:hypothetical protein
MKPVVLFVLALALIVPCTGNAQDPTILAGLFKQATVEQTEKSLVMALESESPGLQMSAALTVRELKALMPERSFSCFVIPLMRIVKTEEGDRWARVVAAIALHDLHSAIGDFAIARTAKFCECERLKNTCIWLAYYRLLEAHPELAPRVEPGAQLAEGTPSK